MNPEEPIVEGRDYSELGFGFNTADGGGFLSATDLLKGTTITELEIKAV